MCGLRIEILEYRECKFRVFRKFLFGICLWCVHRNTDIIYSGFYEAVLGNTWWRYCMLAHTLENHSATSRFILNNTR